mgnify:FL=1
MDNRHPILIILASYSIGLLTGYNLNLMPMSYCLVFLAIILIVSSLIVTSRITVVCVQIVFWIAAGITMIAPHNKNNQNNSALFNGDVCIFEGIVSSRALGTPEGERFELDLEKRLLADKTGVEIKEKVLISVGTGRTGFFRGDRIRISGRVWIPRLLGLPGEFDYPSYLAFRNIGAVIRVKDASDTLYMGREGGQNILGFLDSVACRYDSMVRQFINDRNVAPIITAMVTGSQSEIPPDLRTAYAKSGVLHILSISGLHVAIIAAVFVQLISCLLSRSEWLVLRIDIDRKSVV